jgi:N-acyl-D-amino-acid deacylase
MDFAAAIRKMTSLPASRLKLKERGMLVPGYYADVVVLDPASVIDTATFENPHSFPQGIAHVWVNGKHTIKNGTHTGALAGMVL